MFAHRLRIGLAILWLGIGLSLLFRDVLFPIGFFAKYDASRLTLAGGLAVALAVWNGVRAYRAVAVRRNQFPNPLRREPETNREEEYHPEFDFTRPTDQETGGKPNTSTD